MFTVHVSSAFQWLLIWLIGFGHPLAQMMWGYQANRVETKIIHAQPAVRHGLSLPETHTAYQSATRVNGQVKHRREQLTRPEQQNPASSISAVTKTPRITITTGGFNPDVLTATTSTAVEWYNQTGVPHILRSGLPKQTFLPIVIKDAANNTSSTGQLDGGQPLSEMAPFVSSAPISATVLPGGVYSHTFSTAGQYDFYLATAPQFSGQVIIQESSVPTVSLVATPTTGTAPLTVLFSLNVNTPPGQILTSSLSYGDGITATFAVTTSHLITTSHFYPVAGVYTATVTAQDGQNTLTATQIITVNDYQINLPPDPANSASVLDNGVITNLALATEFLYTGPDPIQTGVSPGTIEPKRVAVLRGKVLTRDGSPLSGATVTILGHPEFGQTLSRQDGMFDLVVNGGGWLTVNYEKPGFLPAQRQIDAPWQDYVWLPDVVMIPYDSQVTTIDLTLPVEIQVAQGSTVSDADGTRRATLLVPQGTLAELVMPNGTTQTVSSLHIRATEYTVGDTGPAAMPAELPPQSGYTYALEFSVDEAEASGAVSVSFNRPLFHYVENFLNFPVGMAVPVGYYDRSLAQWLPSQNGRVIKIISIAGGAAELDTDGDDAADDSAALGALGVTDAERRQLAVLYQAGQSLWRIPISHFTPVDYNWPAAPPADADDPQQPEPQNDRPEDDDCEQPGSSVIECQDQILGEMLDLVGTPFTLNYRSNRVPGRTAANKIEIPLSGDTLPASLKRIDLEIEIAGRRFEQSFSPVPNQSTTFNWDGQDAYGRTLQGLQPVEVRLGYVYDAVYQEPAQLEQSFAAFSGVPITGSLAREEFTLWQMWQDVIGVWDARGQGLGGWSLNIHHAYDPTGRILFLGNGQQRSTADSVVQVIETVAGNGSVTSSGDGGPATEAGLGSVRGVVVGPDGSIYITAGDRIRKVDPNGIITTVAGGGNPPTGNGDGGPATQAELLGPGKPALGPDGSIYIPDQHRIRKVGPDGLISTVAGTGVAGFSGDGGPATNAQLDSPGGVAVAPDGSLYIADWDNNRVRRVGPNGIITTVAGNGDRMANNIPTCSLFNQICGDGGPANEAVVGYPEGVAVGPDGSIYVTGGPPTRIRRVTPDGIITSIDTGFGIVWQGSGIDFGADGNLYISRYWGTAGTVYRVNPDETLTAVAGGGIYGYLGDGGPATQAFVEAPEDVAVGPDGSLYIAEFVSNRVRRVSPPLPGATSATELAIPSETGGQLYVFEAYGRHLRTLNTFTGAKLYEFSYDSQGFLAQVQDGDGNITLIERSASGNPTAVVGPYGQRTNLTLDANGYLASVSNPAGELTQLSYTSAGLLTGLTNPRGHTYHYTYDPEGRLTQDDDPVGGLQALTRSTALTGYLVTRTTALSRVMTYGVETLADDGERQTNTFPDGTQATLARATDGSRITTMPDGTVYSRLAGPDPRFAMQAPVPKRLSTTTPGGLVATSLTTRTVKLADPDNPLSLITMTEIVDFNGRLYSRRYDAADQSFTGSTPAGRQNTSTIDALGRTTQMQVTGLAAIDYSYDSRGRLASVTQGSGAEARTITFGYNSSGYLSSIADPLGRTASLAYDAAGRVLTQTLADGRQIYYDYDATGNLTGITPPGRPPHRFTYTPVNRRAEYVPPDIGAGSNHTLYSYNFDRQPTLITRPDGQTIQFDYDYAGRLNKLTTPRGAFSYTFSATTGRLETITTPENNGLTYTYDGALPTGESWTGSVTGNVSHGYDDDFRVVSQSINGSSAVTYHYDQDSLLVQAGNLAISRNAQNGLLTGSTLGSIADGWTYNSFAEPTAYTATYNAAPLYSTQFSRDRLGRITQKTENIGGVTTVYSYTYDLAGRLTEVWQDGLVSAAYTYDPNGNRLSGPGGVSGSYDDQDRLLQYGSTVYTYTTNGELQSKTNSGQTTSYAYDVLGNLMDVTLPGGTQIVYVVDGENRRIGKKVNGALVQGFLYQDGLNPVAELDSSGNVVSRFIYGSRANVPDYIVTGGVAYRIIADHLGSSRLVVDAGTGAVAQRLDYDAFGRVIQDTNPGFQPFGFAGGLYDPDTGLVRFGARDYDAEVGRWTAKDPILFDGGDANLYGYVLENPINFIDSTGKIVFPFTEKHRNRNKDNRQAERLTHVEGNKYMDEEGNICNLRSKWQAAFHGGHNVFERPDGKGGSYETVRDSEGNRVKGKHRATRNYSESNNKWDHFWNDVFPHLFDQNYTEYPE